jgi:hypothetical protein
MQYAADHTPVVHSLFATNVRRQVGLDLLPLIIVEPKQVGSHRLLRLTPENQQPILSATDLLGFDPSTTLAELPGDEVFGIPKGQVA